MILREYQALAVNRGIESLKQLNNTLLVLPTGGGKTVCLSALISEFIKESSNPVKVLILQHRKEIVWQNMQKFSQINPSISMSLISQESKDNSGIAVFAMIQTLHKNLELICHYDLIVIDEAHHAVAPIFLKVINKVKNINPKVKIYGVTATPLRGDKKTLVNIFNNISYSVDIENLISVGVLVMPKAYVLDIGLGAEIERRTHGQYSLSNLELDNLSSDIIQAGKVDNQKAVRLWKELAGDRKTVVFTPKNIDSILIAPLFEEQGIKTAIVTHDTSPKERERILNNFQFGDTQVLLNTSILTEGWDCPIASCIVLFKSSSYKSTYIQMVGRGLRSYPNKQDCLIIDFGVSTTRHGSLEQNIFKSVRRKEEVNFTGQENNYYKVCPGCGSTIPEGDKICFICGYEFQSEEEKQRVITEFKLKEIEIVKQLEEKMSYKFCEVKKSNYISVVGLKSFVWILNEHDQWYLFSNLDTDFVEVCGLFKSKSQAYEEAYKKLRYSSGKESFLKKDRDWLDYPPTDKQLFLIKGKKVPSTRYEATCRLTYQFNVRNINRLLYEIKAVDNRHYIHS